MTDLTIIQKIAVWALPLIFAITLHEVAHGYVALLFGDHTARLSGRLTLNPIKHIDPIGTVLIPVVMLLFSNFIFGWAKPVPVDSRNLHHPRRDMAFVALAGPVSNLLMALFWGVITKIGLMTEQSGSVWLGTPLVYMGGAGIMINVVLAVLNLIPLPPLDGGKVLSSLLPPRAAYSLSMIEPYGFYILIILMFTGVLSRVMIPVVFFIIDGISSLFGLAT
jgi:Zn-dependent protease